MLQSFSAVCKSFLVCCKIRSGVSTISVQSACLKSSHLASKFSRHEKVDQTVATPVGTRTLVELGVILIKYKLERSMMHGIGLFTDEDLRKGQLVYVASPKLDVDISQEEFNTLDEKEKAEVRYWGFRIEESNTWHVDFDVTRFVNHSFSPTLTQDPSHQDAYLITTRDVKKGEELTQDYLEFESEKDLMARGIVISGK